MPGPWTDSPAAWPMEDGSAPSADTLRHRARMLAVYAAGAAYQAQHTPKYTDAWMVLADRLSARIDAIEGVLRNATKQETTDA